MYENIAPDASPACTAGQAAVQCKDCGNNLNFYGPIGFCRLCGGPLCAQCTGHRVEYTDSRTDTTKNYLVYTETQTRKITTSVALCASCHSSHEKRLSRITKWIFGIMLGVIIFAVVALAATNQITLTTVCWGVGTLVFVMIVAIVVAALRSSDEIKPVCPVCGIDAIPYIYAQNPAYGEGERKLPNFIRCSCGYVGPLAPLYGFWKYVEARGPTALDGTPLAQLAHHSWEARRRYRRA